MTSGGSYFGGRSFRLNPCGLPGCTGYHRYTPGGPKRCRAKDVRRYRERYAIDPELRETERRRKREYMRVYGGTAAGHLAQLRQSMRKKEARLESQRADEG